MNLISSIRLCFSAYFILFSGPMDHFRGGGETGKKGFHALVIKLIVGLFSYVGQSLVECP